MTRDQRRPFGLGLLHPVFAEDALAGGDHRLDGSAAKVFDTATSVTLAGSRPASRQARAMSARTAASPCRGIHGFHFGESSRRTFKF